MKYITEMIPLCAALADYDSGHAPTNDALADAQARKAPPLILRDSYLALKARHVAGALDEDGQRLLCGLAAYFVRSMQFTSVIDEPQGLYDALEPELPDLEPAPPETLPGPPE